MTNKNTRHLAIRYSDNLLANVDTIVEHKKILEKYGYVWIGKAGRPLAIQNIELLCSEIEKGHPTYLFLVTKGCKGYIFHRADILDVRQDLPNKERKKVPVYYRPPRFSPWVRLWLKVKRIVKLDTKSTRRIIVYSSGQPLTTALTTSMSGLFLVKFPHPNCQIQRGGRSF